MATFTQLSADELRALADTFALGEVRDAQAIAAGTINSNFHLSTARGRYFLRINEGKSEGDVRYEAELVVALAAAGVPTPAPVLTRDGHPYAAHGDKWASVFPWVDGVHRCTAAVTQADAAAVGAALARLHLAGLPLADRFARAGIYTYADIVARYESFRELDDPALHDARFQIADEIAWLDGHAVTRAEAPRGIIHGDLFRDNVLFAADGALAALIDFEQASSGSLVYDLAVCLNAWCFGDDFDLALVRAMIDGYAAVRPLDAAERAALPVECRAAAMRFAVTRITDVHLADTVSTKDFRRFLARMRRWAELSP